MELFEKIQDLRQALAPERSRGRRIALVPTMGALHQGHLSLISAALKQYDVCVASVFVNPTQFNDPKDLESYPRTPQEDFAKLQAAGCHMVFAPSVQEMYPEPDERVFDFGAAGRVMEGAFRPGHFNGVAQVVSKLFRIVEPHGAFFGEKDFQQIAIIRLMVQQLGLPVQIHPCPIVREESGLALSSRNKRLSDHELQVAPRIYATLRESVAFAATHTPRETERFVVDTLSAIDPLRPEYYQIVDAQTLQPLSAWTDTADAVGCIACYCGAVRLIDNIHYPKR